MKKTIKKIAMFLAILLVSMVGLVACQENLPEYSEENEAAVRAIVEGALTGMFGEEEPPEGFEEVVEQFGDSFITALQKAGITDAEVTAILELPASLAELDPEDMENPVAIIDAIFPLPVSNTKLSKFLYNFADEFSDMADDLGMPADIAGYLDEVLALGEAEFTRAFGTILDMIESTYTGELFSQIGEINFDEDPTLEEVTGLINAMIADEKESLDALNTQNLSAIVKLVKIFVPVLTEGIAYDAEGDFSEEIHETTIEQVNDLLDDFVANYGKFKISMLALLDAIDDDMIEAFYKAAYEDDFEVFAIVGAKLLNEFFNANGGLDKAALKPLILKYQPEGDEAMDAEAIDAMLDEMLEALEELADLDFDADLSDYEDNIIIKFILEIVNAMPPSEDMSLAA